MVNDNKCDPGAVRDLLLASYTAETLCRFLLYSDHPRLQAICYTFVPGDGLAAMLDKVILHAGRQGLLGELLARVAADLPEQYARLAHRLPPVTAREAYVPPPAPDLDQLPEPGPLPPGSRLPFARNAIFTGRQATLQALARGVLHDGRPALVTQAAQGLGGVGKTQLAVEFAWRYGRFFRGVHWVSAARPAQIGAEIAACGQTMELWPWPAEMPLQVERTLAAWRATGPRLVVLDNLEDLQAVRAWWPKLHQAGVRVVLTARRRAWPRDLGIEPLRLPVFTPQESRAFLRHYVPTQQARDRELAQLAARLGRLPLALELAGRHLQSQPSLTVAGYLERLAGAMAHAPMTRWVGELDNAVGHDLTVARTFALSWEQVEDEGTRQVFLAAAWCAPDQVIPCQVLASAAGLDEPACVEALARLLGLGLLAGEAAAPAIHPLLGEYGRAVSVIEFEALEAVARALQALTDEANETGLPARFASLRAHVLTVAEASETAGVQAAAELWNGLGYHLGAIADCAGARAAFERALRIDEAAFGPHHPTVARDVNNLGSVLHALGDPTGAWTAYARALAIWQRVLGPQHPNVVTVLNNLGGVLRNLGHLAEARAAFERALRIDEAAFGPEHPTVARDVNNLGSVLHDLGDLAGARAAFERALAIWQHTLPAGHPSIELARKWLAQCAGR
jgi:tetratricopeptide (TPR) repeat protein